jgi:hypothetical protein
MAGVAFAVEGDGVGFATESYAASALYTTLANLWRIRRVRAQIARVRAAKNMPAEKKTEALAELDNALKSPAPPVVNKGNIDLVATYYDKLAVMMGSDQQ